MADEKTPQGVAEMTDADLERVSGGLQYHATSSGKYYMYVGGFEHMFDCYLCPKCRVTLASTWLDLGVYRCPTCGAKYWNEKNLSDSLNLSAGCWEEISKEDYDFWAENA